MEAKWPKMFLPAMSPLKAANNDELMMYPPNPFHFYYNLAYSLIIY